MNKKKGEHGTVQHAVDKTQDAVGGVAGKMKASMVSSADSFVENAAIGDRYEVRAAQVALQRASSAEVKAIAKKMILDHTASTHHLQAALEMNETRGVAKPPNQVDTRRQKMLEHLDAAPADKFDATYLDQQRLAHEETLSLMESYRDRGDNPQLRSYAAGTAPVVSRHLEHMKHLKSQLQS